jgi:hypothetical protein
MFLKERIRGLPSTSARKISENDVCSGENWSSWLRTTSGSASR